MNVMISTAACVFILAIMASGGQTPTKSVRPKSKTDLSSDKSCVVCNRGLGIDFNYKKYKSINTEDFANRISRIVDCTEHVKNKICGVCMTQVVKIEKQEALKADFICKYNTTRHSILSSTPTTPEHSRIKRMSTDSPSPSSKSSSKARKSLDMLSRPTTISAAQQSLSASRPQPQASSSSRNIDEMCNLTLGLQNLQMQNVFETIDMECQDLCSTNFPSSFRLSSKRALLNWSYKDQEDELKEKAPILLGILTAAATSQSMSRAKSKTPDSMRPAIMTAAGTLLQCRNQHMVAHATLTGLQLDVGGASKMCQKRMHSKSLSIAPSTIKNKETEFGVGFDEQVLQWKTVIEEDERTISELEEQCKPLRQLVDSNCHQFQDKIELTKLERQIENAKANRHPGFKMVGDNIDFSINPRYWTMSAGRKSIHYFNFLAIENRISGNHLPDDKPIADDITVLPLTTFLPNCEDNRNLREHWIILIGRVLTRYIKEFNQYKKYIPDQTEHEYSHLTKKKTKVVPLGVITESENSKEGIVKIMDHMNKYVPSSNTDKPVKTVVSGDLLTAKMMACIQEDRRGESRQARWSGMMPCIEDWHALANFYQVIWKNLYNSDPKGCQDVGTLYAARNFLKANNVPTDPMKDFYACEELLTKYAESLIISAAFHHFGMGNIEDSPTKNWHADDGASTQNWPAGEAQDEGVEARHFMNALGEIIDKYAIHHSPAGEQVEEGLNCPVPTCTKTYKTQSGLRSHIKTKHADWQETNATSKSATISQYCKTALGMSLLALSFNDARRHGDGGRMILIYKFFILHYRAARKDNYAHYSLRLISQVHGLLTPRLAHQVTWNRFVNNKGHGDTNIECDKENEHQNKVIKGQCRGFRGKLSEASIKRVSECAQTVQEIINKVDRESGVKHPSGKHERIDSSKDVLALVDIMSQEDVFTSDRKLKGLKGFVENPFTRLNMQKTCNWMKTSLKEFARHKVFKC